MFSKVTFILVLVSLCRAQENDPNQQASPAKLREWGQQSGAHQLSISSDEGQYAAGETVRVTAVLKNVTDESVLLMQQDPAIFYDMDIRVPVQPWIPLSPRAALTEFGERQRNPAIGGSRGGNLKPGDESIRELELNKLYYMTIPGDYRIRFSCKVLLKRQDDPRITVTSNEIKVTILPEAK
jgi:hypothetical protein